MTANVKLTRLMWHVLLVVATLAEYPPVEPVDLSNGGHPWGTPALLSVDVAKLEQWYNLMVGRLQDAGKAVQSLASSGERSVIKKKQDGTTDDAPVTTADIVSDKILRGDPSDDLFPVVDEESSGASSSATSSANATSHMWTWIDPLDATREYSEGLDEYVSLMACVTHFGTPVAGIIHFPSRGETWGARVTDDKGKLALIDAPTGWKLNLLPGLMSKVIVSRTKEHQSGHGIRGKGATEATGASTIAGIRVSSAAEQVHAGGAGYKVVEVLSSRVAAYIHTTLIKGWDVCAGDAVLRAAGGYMVDLNGKALMYQPEDPSQRGGIFAVLHKDRVSRRALLSIDGEKGPEGGLGMGGKRKRKKKKVLIGPLIGMIVFVAFLRAVLPKSWYMKEEKTRSETKEKNGSVELTSSSSSTTSTSSTTTTPTTDNSRDPPEKTKELESTWKHLVFCVAGIQVCYLAWGTAQERLMSHSYGATSGGGDILDGEHFQYSSVLLLINKSLSAFFAIVLLVYAQSSSGDAGGGSGGSGGSITSTLQGILFKTAPPLLYAYAALGNGISSWCQYEALKHTIFPVVVVFKSSKMIPVMLIGYFFGKRYNAADYAVVLTIAFGVGMSLLAGGKHHNGDVSVNTKGLLLMIGYIVADSWTSNFQSHVFNKYKSTSLHMMFSANVFSSVIVGFTVRR